MKKLLCVIPLLLILLLSGCEAYVKENGIWNYVTYSEAGKHIQEINTDNGTFMVLDNKKYAKDEKSVYLEGHIIKDANPEAFQVINNLGYSKDDKYVFINEKKIIDANPQTFVFLDFPYSKDDKHVYCGTLPMDVKKIDDFIVTKRGSHRVSLPTSDFLEDHPDYPFTIPEKYTGVFYTEDGKGETKDQKFESFKEMR